jgi:hypothetical protein
MWSVLFQNTEGKQTRSLRPMNSLAEIRSREFFPVNGEFRLGRAALS